MAWITLNAARAKQRLTGAEYNAIKAAALNSGQDADTLVTDLLARTTQEVRGYVSGCSGNTLGSDGTIPDELEDAALAVFVYKFITRLPNMKALLDAQRVAAYGDALKLLASVSACKFGIVPPTTASESQAAGPGTELISSRTRVATKTAVDGML